MTETQQVPPILDADAPRVAIADLKKHPHNPKVGDRESIRASILDGGFYGTVVVQKSTNIILAGWHRSDVFRELGSPVVPVSWIDVDDEAAAKIVAKDNRTNELGGIDKNILADLLESIADRNEEALQSVGYGGEFLDGLLREIGAFAERGASFLDDPDPDDDDEHDGERPPAAERPADTDVQVAPAQDAEPAWYALSYSVSKEDRAVIQDAIRKAKERLGDSRDNPVTSAQALVSVCEFYR